MNEAFSHFMKHFRSRLLERTYLIQMFTETNALPELAITTQPSQKDDMGHMVLQPADPETLKDHKDGTIFKTIFGKKTGFAFVEENILYEIPKVTEDQRVPFDLYDEIQADIICIANATEDPIKTTVGRYILNELLLASVFGSTIPYVNDLWNIGTIEKRIAAGLSSKEFTMEQYNSYMNHGYYLGHFAELCVPTMTERSFTTDPAMATRKAELLEKYAGQLKDPNVIAVIEAELMAMDKAWLEGDESLGFHGAIGGKSFGVHRKKTFCTVGGIESFDDEGGNFDFVDNALVEGWDIDAFQAIANDIRKGSYSRGKETAKGGALTKFILRVFQDVRITVDDCGTTRGLKKTFSESDSKAFLGRTIIVSGKSVMLTKENFSRYVGKLVTLRSPTHCKAVDGLCFVCSGDNFRSLGVEAIGPLAIAISSKFMLASMKALHGKQLEVVNVDPYAYFA